ncbi:MAG: DUF3667 domain-containing protein [Cyclobacteriaceae bacterium]|nr:DUF3667 domain-containing protein [Cyclobacteriaceae bacterium]
MENILPAKICINCSAEIAGKYCNQCGQRADVKRITWKEGWYDFWARIYGFDGMFPRTLRDLTICPGKAARVFISGNRSAYYGPVGYFFLMGTLFLLVLSFLNLDFIDFMKGMQKAIPIQQTESQAQVLIQRFAADNLKLISFLLIPFQAFAARYIFFRKSGFNFLENWVLPLYVTGHVYWFTLVTAVYYKVTGVLFSSVATVVISLAYFGFAYTSFIPYQPKLKVFLKGALLYIVSQLLMMIVAMVVMVIWILLLAWLDPDALKMFKPGA